MSWLSDLGNNISSGANDLWNKHNEIGQGLWEGITGTGPKPQFDPGSMNPNDYAGFNSSGLANSMQNKVRQDAAGSQAQTMGQLQKYGVQGADQQRAISNLANQENQNLNDVTQNMNKYDYETKMQNMQNAQSQKYLQYLAQMGQANQNSANTSGLFGLAGSLAGKYGPGLLSALGGGAGAGAGAAGAGSAYDILAGGGDLLAGLAL